MRPRVKLCCIQDDDELRAAVDAGADAIGFVGRGLSGPEVIDDDAHIAALSQRVPPPVASVLLLRDTDVDTIVARATATRAAIVQLIAPLSAQAHAALAHRLPTVRRVGVVHVTGSHALDDAAAMAPHVDALLLDSGSPADGVFGGTGATHDWALSARIVAASPVPVWLAGGLHPDNVGEALRVVRPFGIDVCSGVRRDGRLDPARAAALVRAAHDA